MQQNNPNYTIVTTERPRRRRKRLAKSAKRIDWIETHNLSQRLASEERKKKESQQRH